MPQPIHEKEAFRRCLGGDKFAGGLNRVIFFLQEGSSSLGAADPGGSSTNVRNCSLGFSSCWAEGLEKIARAVTFAGGFCTEVLEVMQRKSWRDRPSETLIIRHTGNAAPDCLHLNTLMELRICFCLRVRF